MSERLTEGQRAAWDQYIRRAATFIAYGRSGTAPVRRDLLVAVDAELRALQAELAANAAMLARQCDLAREAETQLAEARRWREVAVEISRHILDAADHERVQIAADEPTGEVPDLPQREASE